MGHPHGWGEQQRPPAIGPMLEEGGHGMRRRLGIQQDPLEVALGEVAGRLSGRSPKSASMLTCTARTPAR